jgi:hypothetical protein
MRVRLSYSVELEDVPDAVAELIEGELYRLENAKEGVGKALEALSHEEPHLDLVAKALDKTRQLLGAIDVRLNECESILAGYERAMNPPEPQPQPVIEKGILSVSLKTHGFLMKNHCIKAFFFQKRLLTNLPSLVSFRLKKMAIY